MFFFFRANMSGPPPPPPPPGPGIPSFSPKSNAADDGRSLLLESIRKGKQLKKAVTVDKSAPAIGGKQQKTRFVRLEK